MAQKKTVLILGASRLYKKLPAGHRVVLVAHNIVHTITGKGKPIVFVRLPTISL